MSSFDFDHQKRIDREAERVERDLDDGKLNKAEQRLKGEKSGNGWFGTGLFAGHHMTDSEFNQVVKQVKEHEGHSLTVHRDRSGDVTDINFNKDIYRDQTRIDNDARDESSERPHHRHRRQGGGGAAGEEGGYAGEGRERPGTDSRDTDGEHFNIDGKQGEISIDKDGNTVRTVHGNRGQVFQVVDSADGNTRKITETMDGEFKCFTISQKGKFVESTDSDGRVFRREWKADGTMSESYITPGNGAPTDYSLTTDAKGNVVPDVATRAADPNANKTRTDNTTQITDGTTVDDFADISETDPMGLSPQTGKDLFTADLLRESRSEETDL
jgi:hypothetical protein